MASATITYDDFSNAKLETIRSSELSAVVFNCTLKPTPQTSHTDRLLKRMEHIFEFANVDFEIVRAVDYNLAPGVKADMRDDGFEDEWPELAQKVRNANIIILATPIWLGEESSVCRKVIERLYGMSAEQNDQGQYAFYGKVGAAVVTGNEDGVKHCSMSLLYALNHIGCTIAPQADTGWIGEVGPGKSFGDEGAGLENTFTKRTTTFAAWNAMHLAAMLKMSGMPDYGNNVKRWQDGERFAHP